ncbi:MAG TPA: 50S ribosomal protein L29 [Candidatus Eisenbacteria bacterium]|jgi:large subunit ribosomal protein L29|nr:50S ribosomal protein L29 [Candidatus Eisenbacteria bacterium]
MKISELREKSEVELDRMVGELRNRVRDLRFKVASRQLNDVREIREARQAIAQILTLKRSRRKA